MKFEIKKRSDAQGSSMSTANYDVLIDGKEVEPRHLVSIEIKAEAAERPTVCLTYSHIDLDIELDGVDLNKRSD